MTVLKILVEPPDVELDGVEDVLVTDDLFVDYLNSFLALPSFPEPLCFNKETGGFEVVSPTKASLAEQIKEVIRSQRPRSKICRIANKHSYQDIPLIPLRGPQQPSNNQEIDTMFTVTTLNKEQGIQWIRAERLPIFLESHLYVEYRLAKLVSQVKVRGDNKEFISLKIDYTPRPRKRRRKGSITEIKEDPVQVMMKNMYVSMGVGVSTDTEAWFSKAKMAHDTDITYSMPSRPKSAFPTRHSSVTRPKSARPGSALSNTRQQCDSGLGKPLKSTSMSWSECSDSMTSLDEQGHGSQLFQKEPWSISGTVNANVLTDEDHEKGLGRSTVYVSTIKQSEPGTDTESGVGDVGDTDRDDSGSECSELGQTDPASESCLGKTENQQQPIDKYTFSSLDEFASVVVGTILSHSIAQLQSLSPQQVQNTKQINGLYPNNSYRHFTLETLEKARLDEPKITQETAEKDKQKKPQIPSSSSDESDVDSLLDSEDDYEPEDVMFRQHTKKQYPLTCQKGVEQFKQFLAGTHGEKYWRMWVDIDRGHFLSDGDDIQQHLSSLRELYHSSGAAYELSWEMKTYFGLCEVTEWTMEKLFSIQNSLAASILLYWAPRFLLAKINSSHSCPRIQQGETSQSAALSHMRRDIGSSCRPCVDRPRPSTGRLLPHRPKTCTPRIRSASMASRLRSDVSETDVTKSCPSTILEPRLPATSPYTGRRRIYSEDTLTRLYNHFHPGQCEQAKQDDTKKVSLNREKVTPRMLVNRQPPSRPQSSQPRETSARPQTASNRPSTRASSAVQSTRGGVLHPASKSKPGVSAQQQRLTSQSETALSSHRIASRLGSRSNIELSTHQPSSSQPGASNHQVSSSRPSSSRRGSSRPGSSAPHLPQDVSRRGSLVGHVTPIISPSSRGYDDSASLAGSEGSEFAGSQRMELLLQALHYEKQSGEVFRRYIEQSSNVSWLNCLDFWADIQTYHQLFFQYPVDKKAVNTRAKSIYSQYILPRSVFDICCSRDIQSDITRQLDLLHDELFDRAEGYCLKQLYVAWLQMLAFDMQTYSKVELIDTKRRLETKNKYFLCLQKKGLIRERAPTPEDLMDGYEDPVYDETLLENIPEDFHDFSLVKLTHNRLELEEFRQFLQENYAGMDLMCWMDIEEYRRIAYTEEKRRDEKAKQIKTNYLNKKYFFGPNSPAGKEGQEKVMQMSGGWGKLLDDRPPNTLLLETQTYVQKRLDSKWLPLFLTTPGFALRQQPQQTMKDVVDDVIVQKRHRTQNVHKLLESKWVSSSKELMIFRKGLLNPVTSHHFRRYVSIKADSLENDVLFWQEVQKFKVLYNSHADDALVQQKINAIISCFIDSHIPPNIQIDITEEQAEKILDRRHERGPYLFREAQLCVFRVLFSHWNDFCDYRSNLADDDLLPSIEKRRRKRKARDARREEKAEQQGQTSRRIKSADGEGDDADGDGVDITADDPYAIEETNPDNLSWSYSHYMDALVHEQMLNNLEEESTLSTSTSESDLGQESLCEESHSAPTSRTDQDSNHSRDTDKTRTSNRKNRLSSRSDKLEKIEEEQNGEHKVNHHRKTTPEKVRKESVSMKSLSNGSFPLTNGIPVLDVTPLMQQKVPLKPLSKGGAGSEEPNGSSGMRLARTMPPLVQKKT